MVSPAAAIRMYSLSRLLSTLIPTALTRFTVATCCYTIESGMPTGSGHCREFTRQSKSLRSASSPRSSVGTAPRIGGNDSGHTESGPPHVRPLQGVGSMRERTADPEP